MAWVASKSILRKSIEEKEDFEGLIDLIFEGIISQDKASKEKLLDILWNSSRGMYEVEKGDTYIIQMKCVMTLIKINENWSIQYTHFSENADDIPEERIIKQ